MKKELNKKTGFTLTELLVTILISMMLIGSVGFFIYDSQKSWSQTYKRVYEGVFADSLVAHKTFDAVCRKATMTQVQKDPDGKFIELFYYQDAGIAHALYLMNQKIAAEEVWDNSSLPSATNVSLPNSNESYSFAIKGDAINGFVIRSTGRSGQITKTVNAELGPASLWFGIGVNQNVDVKAYSNFYTIPAGSDFTILTNENTAGSILIKTGVTIPGDVVVGPGGDPEIVIDGKAGSTILGDTYAISEEIEFPYINPPPGLPYRGSITTSEIITQDGRYDTINLPNSGVLNIQGKVTIYVSGAVILNSGSTINLSPGSSLYLYLGGNLEDKNSAGIFNGTGDAKCLKIFGTETCTSINIKAKSEVFGAIYAPGADIQIFNDGDFYGAVVAESFGMKNSGSFYFVAELAKTGINDDVAQFTIRRWWE